MEITIKAEAKEIAALVVALQERRDSVDNPLAIISESVRSAIDGTELKE